MSNIETSQAWFDGWRLASGGEASWDALLALVSDRVAIVDHATGRRFDGRDGVQEFVRSFEDSFTGAEGDVELSEARDKVVIEFTVRSTHTGAFQGIEATGAKVELPMCGIQTFDENGKIARYDVYYDQVALLAPILARALPTMSSEALAETAAKLAQKSFAAGETVIREGDPADRFYVIQSGMVEVSRDGKTLSRLGPGMFFGEVGLLTEQPRNATVRAVEDVELLSLEKSAFASMVSRSQPTSALLATYVQQRSR